MTLCKHCHQPIRNSDPCSNGTWIHETNLQSCNPKDSGLPYGYNAGPAGEPCVRICTGYTDQEQSL